ncbi:MHYT domain-containing protein [Croceicoccus sp. BE223]|uniref:MHYT domain-containing protein n=1 Tax=Croceicoccus sp. BE223 TaxID=2817716 RepID=UPI00285484AF|nr:MHYT domain-containing protein [Croceicoccus sp. BE223]MDR7102880.1 NO-binding membrane sensor protein with MHYT domain/signal transduction histidine kinase [Croceicoccus sp. BE223]
MIAPCHYRWMPVSGAYDPLLVGLSIFIAVFASFTGLSLARRMGAASGHARRIWLGTAAFALGGGIWSMHFVGMLAFSLPGMHSSYDPGITVLSFLFPIILTGFGLAIASQRNRSPARLGLAGLLMGSGVLAMHYLGMAAMQMPAGIVFDPLGVFWSIVIAIVASTIAVWLAFANHALGHRVAASVAMGLAIAGMHYTAMSAASFVAHTMPDNLPSEAGINQASLAMIVAVFSVSLFVVGLGAAKLDQLFTAYDRREARIALRLRVADILREKGSDAALEEIASLMGSHFGVTRTGYGELDSAEDVFDYRICWTDGTVPPLLGRYPAAAFGEKIVAALSAGKTIVVEDLLNEPISDESRTRDTAREVDTRSILVVPFVRDSRLRTIVYLNDREPRYWNGDDIAFMEELAERTRLVIERDAVEQQLRDLNATLEQRVAERTLDLEQTQEALLQSQKMEAVGQLVAGMAHDFNNVLASVISAYNLILRKPEDLERVRRFASAGAEAAERGAKLTGQLMAFSRSQKIQFRPLYVCDVLQGVADLLSRTVGPLIELKMQLNPDPAPVLADAVQVEMMVLNLVINARDAMPAGGTLTISTSKQTLEGDVEIGPGDYVEVAVRDTGTGMDAETLRRSMEPFYTTKPMGKGTGLGLAQIYGSARQAGGTVRIESVLGEGTTVRVYLPCTSAIPTAKDHGHSPTDETSSTPPLHVLLVDDDDALRDILGAGLSDAGHKVSAFAHGRSALALLEFERPHAAVLDFAMPGMNGAELAQQIVARCPDLPVIFVSGFADTTAITNAVDSDAVILQKPFDMRDLLQALNKACG